MSKQAEIISADQTESTVDLKLKIQAEIEYFNGHFPEVAVLPGVVQLLWAEQYGREYGLISGKFARVDKLKFQKIIGVDQVVDLHLEVKKPKELSFHYQSDAGRHSSGKIILE